LRTRPLVISASRRTDLPGFHAEACAERIRARAARLRTRTLWGVVFWTRHPTAFLPGGALHDLVARDVRNAIVNLTITGLGRSDLEPGSPSMDEVLPQVEPLVRVLGREPWRVRWRYDPLIAGRSRLEDFDRIAADGAVLFDGYSFDLQ